MILTHLYAIYGTAWVTQASRPKGSVYALGLGFASCLPSQSFPVLCFCNKYLRLVRKETYFGSWHQRFQPVMGWPHCFQACGKVSHHSQGLWQSKTTHFTSGKQKRNKGRDQSPLFPFQSMSQ